MRARGKDRASIVRVDHRIIALDNMLQRRARIIIAITARAGCIRFPVFPRRDYRFRSIIDPHWRGRAFSPSRAGREREITRASASASRGKRVFYAHKSYRRDKCAPMLTENYGDVFPDVAICDRGLNHVRPRTPTRRDVSVLPLVLFVRGTFRVAHAHYRPRQVLRTRLNARQRERKRERPRRGNANVKSSARKYWYARR